MHIRSSYNQQLLAGRFGHEALSQLCTAAYKTVLHTDDEGFVARTFCNQLLIDTAKYTIAHNQFACIEECSNEPLQHATSALSPTSVAVSY